MQMSRIEEAINELVSQQMGDQTVSRAEFDEYVARANEMQATIEDLEEKLANFFSVVEKFSQPRERKVQHPQVGRTGGQQNTGAPDENGLRDDGRLDRRTKAGRVVSEEENPENPSPEVVEQLEELHDEQFGNNNQDATHSRDAKQVGEDQHIEQAKDAILKNAQGNVAPQRAQQPVPQLPRTNTPPQQFMVNNKRR